ncbi:hypothetical protein H6F77_15115 [Microcoleus sp. FACHB-831]|uniref:hypothetical protein n=1 Tax=Microcoleus sp. FACHB-831 TaxID=2692827 RepID=UPI001688C1DA|nr:hypothetical protein [Microcoleus sp. FACHB-831]MBD1922405.1 hypothetical protein [Microcoleus sp. FACHB-831]
MNSIANQARDEEYIKLVIDPISTCKKYIPKFGGSVGLSLSEFQRLYQADPFYSWFGLDSPLMFTAHKAAGGMTSVYRQVGIGCQRLIQRIVMDSLGLTAAQSVWSYEIQKIAGKTQTLSLDCCIPLADTQSDRRPIVTNWLQDACRTLNISEDMSQFLKGAVFEIRQGYKSKDSKRQNADIANAAAAYSEGYLPVILLLSNQMDRSVADRYRRARWLILWGTNIGLHTNSTYEFCRQVLGYDLANFFQRHSVRLKQEVESVLTALLQ